MPKTAIKTAMRKTRTALQTAYLDSRAVYNLIKCRCRRKSGPVRVGFLAQMPEIWDKQVDVYRELKTRADVETLLFVVPPYDAVHHTVTRNYENNYFLEHYDDTVKAVGSDGSVIDLKSYGLDYVFYQRPYDHYLPAPLRSSVVCAYAKCCYIPYGFSGADVFNAGNTNCDFFRNIYFSFMESAYMQKKLTKNFPLSTALKIRRIENLGYSSLEPYMNPAAPGEVNTVLWTPRWSYDKSMGGSHFLEYRHLLSELKQKYSHLNCIFRPHPLMFEELQSKDLMGKAEIDAYLESLRRSGISYDTGCPINDAIGASDVLITDYSSIIIMFFLTGKPIIYCTSQIELNETFSELARYMYVADTEDDVRRYLDQLLQGNDPLYEARMAYIRTEFAQHRSAAKRIADTLIASA